MFSYSLNQLTYFLLEHYNVGGNIDFSKNTIKTKAIVTPFKNLEKSKKVVVSSSDITASTEISSEGPGKSE